MLKKLTLAEVKKLCEQKIDNGKQFSLIYFSGKLNDSNCLGWYTYQDLNDWCEIEISRGLENRIVSINLKEV